MAQVPEAGAFTSIQGFPTVVDGNAILRLKPWEERKRTTSSGSDAQITGSIAIFNLDRDIKQAGYGIGMATNLKDLQ